MYIFKGDWKPKFRTRCLLHFERSFVTLESERENSAETPPFFFCFTLFVAAAATSSPSILATVHERRGAREKAKKREGECQFLSLGSLTVITVEVAQGSG